MTDKPTFHDPVFVRDDDTTTIRASLVEWNRAVETQMSIRLKGMSESVFINVADWPTLVSCINHEIERLS